MKTPAELVDEIMELANNDALSSSQQDRCRDLGRVLLSTPGTTPLDALGFASIAATILSSLLRQHANGETIGEGLGALAGYVARTVEALEVSIDRASDPSGIPTLH